LGVDAIEIYSELNKEIKISLLNKIRNYSKENKRNIPIIHNLSYFKTIINKIYSNDKSNSNNHLNINEDNINIIKLSDINICEGEDVYFFNNIDDINEFNLMINENFKSRDLLVDDEKVKKFHSNKSLFNIYNINNNINNINYIKEREKEKNEMKILSENIANEAETTMDLNPNFKEKIEFDMNSYININQKADNNNLYLQENLNPNNNININYDDNNNNNNTDLTNILKSGFFGNSNKIYFCTDPPLKNLNFEKGDLIHLNYGDLTLIVEEIYEKNIKCRGLNTGIVKNGSNFSVEGKDHFLNDLIHNDENKLIEEVKETIELDFDFLVMSTISDPVMEIEYIFNIYLFIKLIRFFFLFLNNFFSFRKIKNFLDEKKSEVKIILKIDNPNSINLFDTYVEKVYGIYFSRNDLNIKDSLAKICYNQKNIVNKCGYLGN
jgi:hypothetical protein